MLSTTALLAAMVTLATAQETFERKSESLPLSLQASFVAPDGTEKETIDERAEAPLTLPLSMAAETAAAAEEPAAFSIGPEGGYLRARGAERGTWFGGGKARLHLIGILAAEASITFHENRYDHNDVIVTQYPVQLTAMLYIIPVGPIRPYVLGGVGWYYSRVDYRGALASIPNRTEHIFGEHLGAGAEAFLGPRVSIDADVRYIFLNPTNDQVIHRDFNYWQIAFGVNFYF